MPNNNIYDFGHEGQAVEFKSSFTVSAGNGEEDQKYVIFKAVCAMANTEGGIVYIGVTDDGTIAKGPHYGVKGDRERLHFKNNDSLSRHINQKIDYYFLDPKYVHNLINVEEINEDVIAIKVGKAEDKVVYILDKDSGKKNAFRRQGTSCVRMDKEATSIRSGELAKEKVKNRLSKKENEMRSTIRKAIEQKRKIILYGYCSCHGDTKEDRIIEPIELICDERSIWGYEEKNEGNNPLRQFRLSRMDNVSVLEEKWGNEPLHQAPHVDAFEWSRATCPSIHISIIIGPAARNKLVESTPEASKHLIDNGNGQWTLDTDVHDIEPVRDFCLEFKDSINVFVPDELKAMIGMGKTPPIHIDEQEEKEGIIQVENNPLLERFTAFFANFGEKVRQLFSSKEREHVSMSEIRVYN